MSKGENKIVDLLNTAGLKFVREKSFSDLKHGLFRYDFYLPDVDGGPAIIEFNGEQHYHYVSKFYRTPREWRKMQEHDRRKISYALANKIKIYIIKKLIFLRKVMFILIIRCVYNTLTMMRY